MTAKKQLVVFIASPYAGDIEANVAYALDATRDSLGRGEAPFTPHLLYPRALTNDEHDAPEQRRAGMLAAKAVLARCDLIAVYADLGESSGMRSEIYLAADLGIGIERRLIANVPPGTEQPSVCASCGGKSERGPLPWDKSCWAGECPDCDGSGGDLPSAPGYAQ